MNTPPVTAGHTVAPSQPGLLPPAVRAQVAEANRLIQDLNAPPQPGAPSVSQQPQFVPPTNPSAPPAQQPQRTAAPPPSPQLLQQNQVPVDPAPPADMAEQLRRSEARYQSLQGKYNAETAGLRAQLEQNTALVTQLLERENRQPAPAAPVAPQSPEERMRALGATDKDIEEYGDLLPLVAKLAENMVRPTLTKLEGELNKIAQGQGQIVQQTRASRVAALEAQMDAALPTWRAINESQEFLDWLGITDIFSGVTRRVALTDAYNKLDAARVQGIFVAYAREYPNAARAPGAPQVDAGTLLAPEIRGGGGAAPEGAGGKRIWSESEINDFYARVRKKLVSAEEYKRMMVEIAQASAEGRIVPTRRIAYANGQ
jgi:hypothetical protein